jgi:glucose/arabinose dehydrogenase
VDQRDRKIHQAAGSGFGPASAQSLDAMAGDGHGGLIVADGEGERIWRVAVADGAVTELVGAPRADGLTPADATDDGALRRPRGVAVAPTGEIYVAENTHPRIWQLAADGRPTLLAGSGEGAVFDGYFIGASFKDPLGMAVAPDGSLLVADQDGDRLRRVRHQAGAGMVTSLDVAVQHPRLVAIGPDGTIYVVLNQDPSIRVLRPRN